MMWNEQHDEEDCLNNTSNWTSKLVGRLMDLLWIFCKKYWNIEQLDMCIQKFTEGHIKFTCKG